MSLVLEEFYSHILSIGVSALIQKGFDKELLDKFDQAKKEYDEIFLPEVQKKLAQSLEQTPQINMWF